MYQVCLIYKKKKSMHVSKLCHSLLGQAQNFSAAIPHYTVLGWTKARKTTV